MQEPSVQWQPDFKARTFNFECFKEALNQMPPFPAPREAHFFSSISHPEPNLVFQISKHSPLKLASTARENRQSLHTISISRKLGQILQLIRNIFLLKVPFMSKVAEGPYKPQHSSHLGGCRVGELQNQVSCPCF